MSIFSTILSLHDIPCIFPFYHGVAESTPDYAKHLYRMPTPREFERDLDFFLAHFTPITLHDLLIYPERNVQGGSPRFHLTFDDGLSLCLDPIKSILLAKGIPATFFVNPNFIGNKELFYRYKVSLLIDRIQAHAPSQDQMDRVEALLKVSISSPTLLIKQLKGISYSNKAVLDSLAEVLQVDFSDYLENESPYMRESGIQELLEAGFTLGGHSMTHPLYVELTVQDQIDQSLNSVTYVHKRFNLPYRVFAFPFTDHGVPRETFESLYQGGIQATFGTAGLKRDVFSNHYQRIPMEKWPHSAPGILRKAFGLYIPKMLVGKNRIKR